MSIAERHAVSWRWVIRMALSPIRPCVGDFSRTGPRRDARGARFSGSVSSDRVVRWRYVTPVPLLARWVFIRMNTSADRSFAPNPRISCLPCPIRRPAR